MRTDRGVSIIGVVAALCCLLIVFSSGGVAATTAEVPTGEERVSVQSDYGNATPISEGRYLGSITGDENDIYKMSLDAGDTINTSVVYDDSASNDVNLDIEDAETDSVQDGVTLTTPTTDTVTKRAATEVTSTGTYYIRVYGYDESTTDYTLSVAGSFDTSPTRTPPTASFEYMPADPTTETSVSFDASEATGPDGSIATYEWDFNGDNSTDATGETATYTYSSSGSYAVKLRVIDTNGMVDTTIKKVTIEDGGNGSPPDSTVPSDFPGSDAQFDAIAGDDNEIGTFDLVDAVDGASDDGEYNGVELGTFELVDIVDWNSQ